MKKYQNHEMIYFIGSIVFDDREDLTAALRVASACEPHGRIVATQGLRRQRNRFGGVASLSDLVSSSLRLRPDRIPVGEVRGAEALELLNAWGTGHPGGPGRRCATRSGL